MMNQKMRLAKHKILLKVKKKRKRQMERNQMIQMTLIAMVR